jgi:hypothetical protein
MTEGERKVEISAILRTFEEVRAGSRLVVSEIQKRQLAELRPFSEQVEVVEDDRLAGGEELVA